MNDFFINKYNLSSFIENDTQNKLWIILKEIIKIFPIEQIAYIGLYGSQNYCIDTQESDIDCECFIFPSMQDIIFAKPMVSKTIKTTYGECTIKDIRMMFNELRKVSPNILEIINTQYAILNKDYETILKEIYLRSNLFAHLSEFKLLKGFEGLYHRYSKQVINNNNNNSKYYANTLRIIEIINKILNNPKWEYNNLLIPDNIEYLYWIKTTSDFNKVFRKDYFNNICLETELKLQEYYNNHELVFIPTICEEINKIQNKIMKQYIKLNF